MNRLVIIGNGFDLAHGLPTSYRDFIDDFWSNLKTNYREEKYKEIIEIRKEHDYFLFEIEIKSYDDFLLNLEKYCIKENLVLYKDDCIAQKGAVNVVKFKNIFLKEISKQIGIQNWIDIENEYYRQLKKIINSKCLDISKSIEYWENEQKIQVEKLNKEFEDVKLIFEKYLYEKVEKVFNLSIIEKYISQHKTIYNALRPISLYNSPSTVLKEFSRKEDVDEIKEFFNFEKENETSKNNIMFVNFNYTNTIEMLYKSHLQDESTEVLVNYIHGQMGNHNENKINFGFGDEMDEDYKLIENINDNEYLRNFKSFQYLQNSNYSNLLSYIDSDKFQVLIMGHSCGLSDRTLLNTIFEHENCRSIKVFYHKKLDESDNYTDLIQNISRHFNDKKLMRSKIVNKTLSQPLPQIQLPKKE